MGRFLNFGDVGAQRGLDSACDQVRLPLSYVPLDVTVLRVKLQRLYYWHIAYCNHECELSSTYPWPVIDVSLRSSNGRSASA